MCVLHTCFSWNVSVCSWYFSGEHTIRVCQPPPMSLILLQGAQYTTQNPLTCNLCMCIISHFTVITYFACWTGMYTIYRVPSHLPVARLPPHTHIGICSTLCAHRYSPLSLPPLPSPPTHHVVVPVVGVHEQSPLLDLTAQVGQDLLQVTLLHGRAQGIELLLSHNMRNKRN